MLTKSKGGGYVKPLRDSNLELLRVFAMMAIVAHHSVVNSTVINHIDFASPTANAYFLMVWGMWGKTAINSFILISGYFLCKGQLTWQRWVKLLAEMYFYGIIIMLIFAAIGYQPLTPKILFKRLFFPLTGVNNGFGASFMAFYMFVPIYNVVVNNLTKRQHAIMLCGLLLYFTIAGTFFNAKSMNEPFWYMTLYFIAAYIRLYPAKWTEAGRWATITFIVSAILAIASVILVMACVSNIEAFGLPSALQAKAASKASKLAFYFVNDSNKILALVVGTSAFLAAKNAPTFHSRWINTLSAGTFAVLLIHASSDTMRQWLWQDTLAIPSFLNMSIGEAALRSALIPIAIFIVCSLIDIPRRQWIEKPMMKYLNKK